MTTKSWLALPLCATVALFVALHATPLHAAGADDFTPDGVKLRGDGSVDDSQPSGAMPVVTNETVVNPDGTTTVIRTVSQSATGAAPERTRTMEMSFDADGRLVQQSRNETRTNADGVVVRERSRSMEFVDGVPAQIRTDIRRNDAGEVVRTRERVERADRSTRVERPETVARIETATRPERVERTERTERAERAERPERAERAERVERVERVDRRGRD